ncbi:MAG: winged helix-turn-helix domain-containing protein [Pseudobdellovibrio sp.]
MANTSVFKIDQDFAKNKIIEAQGLNQKKPFGLGVSAVSKAVSHLGYVQIDTINVVERCHHHILYNRIPDYKTQYLHEAQSQEKSVFEYWTHALSYISTSDYKYFLHRMQNMGDLNYFKSVTDEDYKKVRALLKNGPLGIRDIKDDVKIEKTHLWGTSKPSKKALEFGFYKGDFTVSERNGIIKQYDLSQRHFNWKTKPKPATEIEYGEYILNRALRSQVFVNADSICYLENKRKNLIKGLLQKKLEKHELVEVILPNFERTQLYAQPEVLDVKTASSKLTHILSPFDPLVIQRKRLKMFFDYEHLFEAYIPKEKRKYGYFTLPVLHKNNFIALLDLKVDRERQKLLIQNWVWLKKYKSSELKKIIDIELDRFEKFQLKRD